MKIWDKGFSIDKKIENFTVGKDRTLDVYIAEFDILASIAHAEMLSKCKLLSKQELAKITAVLQSLLAKAKEGKFSIDEDVEDVHSQIEKVLIKRLGNAGKKIHTARSRNDQALTAILLFSRYQLGKLSSEIEVLFTELIRQAKKHKKVMMPGYTHTQIAMPSSFGLWFGSYAEMLTFDLELLAGAYDAINYNPLGTAAGYGSSFPIDRKYTTKKLQFGDLVYSSPMAQMLRGKAEWAVSSSLSSLVLTINKLATDICLFNSQNFNFLKLPKEFTTGSSIMPHKKNPDVFELIRANTNSLLSKPNELCLVLSNLMSGYHRDFQLTKEIYITLWIDLMNVMDITIHAMRHMEVNTTILSDKKYDDMFTVENVTKLVREDGYTFRDAYREVGATVESGTYKPLKSIYHTHEGSISNLCLKEITQKFKRSIKKLK